ncbi:MAG: hypothetical protein WC809_04210 [Sinimarinibacterium sp.]|jgi:hypothetical protein
MTDTNACTKRKACAEALAGAYGLVYPHAAMRRGLLPSGNTAIRHLVVTGDAGV